MVHSPVDKAHLQIAKSRFNILVNFSAAGSRVAMLDLSNFDCRHFLFLLEHTNDMEKIWMGVARAIVQFSVLTY